MEPHVKFIVGASIAAGVTPLKYGEALVRFSG